jgi:branched-chain amino acid transport system ATP-binding protein
MLRVENLRVNIAKVEVLRNVSLEVGEGEIACLIGPNGAGKTTSLKSIMGLLKVVSGKISFKNVDITSMPPHERAKLGMSYAPEDRRLYPDFTVWENITFPAKIIGKGEEEIAERIFRIFPELKEQTHRLAYTLSGGQQKMVSVARALSTNPDLILLDEPLEGLAPIVRSRFASGILEMKNEGISVLLAESNISHVKDIADVIYRIKRGEILEA